VLQYEEKAKYDAWFAGWLDGRTESERQFLETMNAKRVDEVHKDGTRTIVELRWVPMIMMRRYQTASFQFHVSGLGENKVGLPVHHFDFDGTKVEVVEACRQYVELLDKMVGDFVKAHP
jgi:hypothetical protein